MLTKAVVITDVPQVNFVPNQIVPIDIPLEGKIFEGRVILEGTISVTDAVAPNYGVGMQNSLPMHLITNIKLRANPADSSRYLGGVLVDCSAVGLLHEAALTRGEYMSELNNVYLVPAGGVQGQGGANGAAAIFNIYLAIPIFWRDENFRKNLKLAFNADPSAYKSLRLEITTQDIAHALPGNNSIVDYSGLKLRWQDERAIVSGDSYVTFLTEHNHYVPGVRSREVIKELPTDGAFLRWLIMTRINANTTQDLSDAILNKLTIDTPQKTIDLVANDLRQWMVDDNWLQARESLTGMYVIDFSDGLVDTLSQFAGDLSDNHCLFDVANPSGPGLDVVDIICRRIFAPANMDGAKS